MLCTVSSPDTIYRTPSVLISITDTPPSVLLYSTLATLAGTRTISRSPDIMDGSSSSAAAAI